ncbi:MAG TPA: DUF2793 domain-containing protein [Sphingobium sp.]|nr:DUF2793 domain-containing protein [Sphingobium sp.]
MMYTDRLGLPLLAAGQAQKEITHNEALALLDVVAQACVESASLSTPPAMPQAGQCWIVAAGATGAWSGQEGAIACWSASGWLLLAPRPGWRIWVQDRGHGMRFDGMAWLDDAVREDGIYLDGERVIAPRRGAIAAPAGGSTRDEEARTAIAALLDALRGHGLIAP